MSLSPPALVSRLSVVLVTAAASLAAFGVPSAAAQPADGPAVTIAAPATLEGPGPEEVAIAANGLYPLWEQTAVLHARGTGQMTMANAQASLGFVQVGTQPVLDLYQAYNLQLKVALVPRGRHRLALVGAAYRLPQNADRRTIGDLHRSGFANAYGPVLLFPVALAYSAVLSARMTVHASGTVLFRDAEPAIDRRPSGGFTALLDLRTTARAAVRVHAGVRGLTGDETAHVGLSAVYAGPHVLLSAGYVRSYMFAGESRGDVLFDAGFLFR